MDKDIVVIGGGPGGYVAAIRAAQLGASVVLVEKDKLGGTCLNRGCIPTKALYRNAEIIHTLKNCGEFGITVDGFQLDVEKIQSRKQKVVNQLVEGVEKLLVGNKVEILSGTAFIENKNAVKVSLQDGSIEEIQTKNIIVASGSKPAYPNIEGINLQGVFTSEGILDFDKIPKSLIVVGAGVIGMELSGIFNALGTSVKVVEFLPNILANIDGDLTKRFMPMVKKRGIEIFTGTKVLAIEKAKEGLDNNLKVKIENKKGNLELEAEAVLISTGRVPYLEGLNLERLGVAFDRKGIKVDENFETNISGIYAIGDVNGLSMLAHAASHQGELVAEKICKASTEVESSVIPACVFVFPEIAYVGLTEEEAKARGLNYKTNKFLFGANGKALALGQGEGLIKVISDSEDFTLLGVHVMGPHASDIIAEATLAVEKKMKVEDFKNVVHAHPTLPEAFYEAIMGLKGEAIHQIKS